MYYKYPNQGNCCKMHSQSFNYLPDKKQPSMASYIFQHLDLIHTFTTRHFSKLEDSKNMNLDLKSISVDSQQENLVRSTIMDFVYGFKDTSSRHTTIPNISEGSKHKDISVMAQYSKMATFPMLSSNLVGGFVGSKSQIGRRKAHGLTLNIRDIMHNLVEIVGHPTNISTNENVEKTALIEKNHCSLLGVSEKPHSSTDNCINTIKPWHSPNRPQTMEQCIKQSYADVARAKSCKSKETCVKSIKSVKPTDNRTSYSDAKDCQSWPENVLEPFPLSSENNCNRNRFTSDSSADSEDSFIVFECCEDDHSIDDDDEDDDDDDEDSCSDEGTPDYHSNKAPSNCGSLQSRNLSFKQCCNQVRKKVRFATGKHLAQIHPMITWNFAYRAARKGPWETLALDSRRFKSRVNRTEEILAPILDSRHRAVVYRLRFSAESQSVTSS